jgi:hypothetical protein
MKGYLVTYTTAARQYEVETVFRQRYVLRGDVEPFYWIGLNIRTFDFWPNFTWSTGQKLGPALYQHWGEFRPGQHLEPNNAFPPEDCAGANYTQMYASTWAWSDAHCQRKFPFMCEIPVATPPPPSPAPPSQLLGYTSNAKNSVVRGARFVYNSTQFDFLAATAACQGMGGTLVVYMSLQEQAEVETALIKQGALEESYYGFYWIGYRVTSIWPNFVPLSSSRPTYTHWGKGQPDSRTGMELCAGANFSMSYQGAWGWADAPCGRKAPFICRLPAYRPPPLPSSPPPPDSPARPPPFQPDPPAVPAPPPPQPPSPPPPPSPSPPSPSPAPPPPLSPSPYPPGPPPPAPRPPPPEPALGFASTKQGQQPAKLRSPPPAPKRSPPSIAVGARPPPPAGRSGSVGASAGVQGEQGNGKSGGATVVLKRRKVPTPTGASGLA